MHNQAGQGENPPQFTQPHQQLHLQNTAYQHLHQLLVLILLAILIFYSIPLSILHYRSCSPSIPCSNSLLLQFSIFSSIGNSSALNLAWYLTLPLALIIFFFLALWNRKLNHLRTKHYQSGRYPDSHACLLVLGSSNVAETHLESQIEHWWETQLDKHKEQIVKLNPESANEQNFELSSIDSGPVIQTSMRSKLVYQIIPSYNYQRLKQASGTNHKGGSGLEWLGLIGRPERNRVLQSAKNKFCLVLFKSSFLAQYFYLAHNPSLAQRLFYPDRYEPMLVQKQPVSVERDLLPNDIFWEYMHLCSFDILLSQLPVWLILAVTLLAASAAWYGVTQLQLQVVESAQEVRSIYVAATGLIANVVAWLLRKVTLKLGDREVAYHYADKQSWILLRLIISDIFILILLPCVLFWAVDQQLLWTEPSLAQILTSSVGFYSVLTILSKLYGLFNAQQLFDCEQQHSRPIFDQLERMGYLLTNLNITLLALTIEPLVVAIVFTSLVLDLLLDKASLGNCLCYGPDHGLNLSARAMVLVKISPLLLGISVAFSGGMLASTDASCTGAVVSGCLLMLMALLGVVLPSGLLFEFETIDVQDSYIEKKQRCLQLYEETNEPYLLSLGQKEYTKSKIEEEMNTLSKTLSLSLKEQLMSRQAPVLGNFNRLQEKQEDQVNSLYFQYEQKVFMNVACPKVSIPPLFERQGTQEEAFDEPVSLGHCSWLDKQAKKIVKKQMRDQFRVGGTDSLHQQMIPQNVSE